MKYTFRRLLGLMLVMWMVPCADGQQIPPVGQGEPIVRTVMANNRITVRDVENDFPVILPGGLLFDNFAPGITGNVRLQEQPDGCDLIYTFTNTGNQPARLGRFNIGKFNLGNNIHYRDFRHVGEPVAIDYNNYAYQAFGYPSGIYSPVWTLYNDEYVVSVSLQYPIMDYKHEARVMLGSTPANAPIEHGPRGWFVEYRLANLGEEQPAARLAWSGNLDANETRTYVVSLRVTKNTAEWIRTLTPYRDYFRSMYGGVQYQRDARPVRPILTALAHLITPDNPYGFDNFQNKRPDRFGWRPWADNIKASDKWSRVMMWAPSGLYDQNRTQNYPWQFTTRWEDEARMANFSDEENGLASVQRANMSLGLWWGRACQVSPEWNSAQWEAFDPDNPAHVRAAFAEMDLAVQAGAKEIGLDTFNPGHTPIWKLVPWLERLREAYPGVKFIIEPITNDIMHRLGATFIIGWTTYTPRQESDLYDLNNPFYLADLLVPGHESWGAFSYHIHRANHYAVNPEMVQRDAERIAELGYVPVMMEDLPDPRNIQAAESWMTTLPADVLRGSGWNLNYNRPHAHRRPDGQLVIVSDSGGAPARPTRGNGRVGGSTPGEPAPGGVNPPGNNPPAGDPADNEPADLAPIERPKKKMNISIKIQREDDVVEQAAPAIPLAHEIPGAKNAVSVPSNANGPKNPKGRGKSNPAWLEMMARKGYMDRTRINNAVREMEQSGGSGGVTVVPSGD